MKNLLKWVKIYKNGVFSRIKIRTIRTIWKQIPTICTILGFKKNNPYNPYILATLEMGLFTLHIWCFSFSLDFLKLSYYYRVSGYHWIIYSALS